MSKSGSVLATILWSTLFAGWAHSQEVVASIEIVLGPPAIAIIEGRSNSALNQREMRFLTTFGSLSDLDKRISNIKLQGSDSRLIESHRVSAGRFIAESDFQVWTYKVDLSAPKGVSDSAHASWADSSGAYLALRDLLPEGLGKARVSV